MKPSKLMKKAMKSKHGLHFEIHVPMAKGMLKKEDMKEGKAHESKESKSYERREDKKMSAKKKMKRGKK